jgi:hypothetical protein
MVREYSPQTQPNQGQNSPPLQSGDSPPETRCERLTRPEFERRYAAFSHIKKAELIEGMVYVASPLRHEQHGKPHSRVITWLGVYHPLLCVNPVVKAVC